MRPRLRIASDSPYPYVQVFVGELRTQPHHPQRLEGVRLLLGDSPLLLFVHLRLWRGLRLPLLRLGLSLGLSLLLLPLLLSLLLLLFVLLLEELAALHLGLLCLLLDLLVLFGEGGLGGGGLAGADVLGLALGVGLLQCLLLTRSQCYLLGLGGLFVLLDKIIKGNVGHALLNYNSLLSKYHHEDQPIARFVPVGGGGRPEAGSQARQYHHRHHQ